jgi:hydrogenase maturation protein HypF
VKFIALAGGCAYNEHITRVIENTVSTAGLQLLRNHDLPAGDGGISYGQAVVASSKYKD